MAGDGAVTLNDLYGVGKEARERGQIAGFVAKVVDGYLEKAKTRITPRQLEAIWQASEPGYEYTLEDMLRGFPGDWANSFRRHNKLVAYDSKTGGSFLPRIDPFPPLEDKTNDPITLEAFRVLDGINAEEAAKRKARKEQESRIPTYYLAQVFSDASVGEKLGFSPAVIALLARTAVGNPSAACKLAVKYAAEEGVEVRVRVGDYAKGRKASRARILAAARGMPARPYDLTVLDGQILVSGTGARDDSEGWTLKADVWQAAEVDALHRIALTRGCTVVGCLFSRDMALLGIHFTPDSVDYGLGFEQHYGELVGSSSGYDVSAVPTVVAAFSDRVRPVVKGGKVVASAVRQDAQTVLLLWHVVSEVCGTSEVDGAEEPPGIFLRGSSGRLHRVSVDVPVGQDLWAAEFVDPGSEGDFVGVDPCLERKAEAGEAVYIVYATQHGVEFSDRVELARVESGTLCMPLFAQARPGLSGAAVIAASDGALLGVYTGANREWALATVVVGREHGSAVDVELAGQVAPGSVYVGGGGVDVYADLVARGLGGDVSRVASSIRPLLSRGSVVGTEFGCGGSAYTVVDPTLWDVLSGEAGEPLDYASVLGGGVRHAEKGEYSKGRLRAPLFGENVLVVYRSGTEVVISQIFSVVWVSPDARRFRISGVPSVDGRPMVGGVVVALADCAPLGLYSAVVNFKGQDVAEVRTWEAYETGVSFGVVPRESAMVDKLSTRFSGMGVRAWSRDDIEALVGDGPRSAAYAEVGLRAVTALVLADVADSFPGASAAVDVRFADTSWVEGLSGVILPGDVLGFGGSAGERAKSVKVFFGIVFLREGTDALKNLLRELGLFRKEEYTSLLSVGMKDRPRSM